MADKRIIEWLHSKQDENDVYVVQPAFHRRTPQVDRLAIEIVMRGDEPHGAAAGPQDAKLDPSFDVRIT